MKNVLEREIELATVANIFYCKELAEEGTPWEVPADPEPDYYETLDEALAFNINLLDGALTKTIAEKQALAERVSVLERALREIMVEVERFEDSEVVVILSPEVRQLARRAEGL